MADFHPPPRNGEGLSADLIAQRGFVTSRRGYDPDEVRAFLGQVATEIRSLRERLHAADAARREAEERALHPKIDEETILAAVGDETAEILRAARAAATEIRSRAEDKASTLLREAQAQAQALRTEAETSLSRVTTEAEVAAEQIRSAAAADAERTRSAARQEAEAMRSQADQERRLTVEAAQNIRENILSDLGRRRRVATVQIEQLRAGRERLLDAYLVVRRTLDEVTDELQRADAEARAASDAVGDPLAAEDLEAVGEESGDAPVTAPHPVVPVAPPPAPPEETTSSGEAETTKEAGEEPAPPPPAEAPTGEGPAASALATIESGESFESVRILRGEDVATTPRTGRSRSAKRRANGGKGSPLAQPQADDAEDDTPPADDEAAEVDGQTESPEAEPPVTGGQAAAADEGDQVEGLFARLRGDQPETEAAVPDADELLMQRRDKATGEIETRLARRLKRALQDEQNDLLDRLRNRKGAPVAAELFPSSDVQRKQIIKAGGPLLEEATRAGARFAHQVFEVPGAKATKDLPAVDELAEQLATDIADPLRRRLEQAFTDAAGDDDAVLVEAVGAAYREWKTQRIEQIAGDHVAGAFSRGSFAAVPDGAMLRWLVEDLGGPCPDCDDNVLAGSQRKGEEFPTGQLFPPAHAGCRCLLVPGEA